ncbi:MAG: hypothetical protein XD74_1114 [Actinobacteria bacterium 66_15]|nr:MAG: hypothetical protein XD74_1114 [Actinobacteria bacterium 66_15]
MHLHALRELGRRLAQERGDLLVHPLVIHHETPERLAEGIAYQPQGKVDLCVDDLRGEALARLRLDPPPQPHEELHVAAQVLLAGAGGRCAHDDACAIGHDGLDDLAQALSLAIGQLA